MKKVKIYTDGACSGNPGPGGWAAVLYYSHHRKEIHGFMPNTTNNQMELMAAINALLSLKTSCEIDLYTDSNYVKNGITTWIANWEKNNWLTSNKKPVKNKELWQQLQSAIAKHRVTWYWVKGHSGIEGNEIADRLAVKAIDNVVKS